MLLGCTGSSSGVQTLRDAGVGAAKAGRAIPMGDQRKEVHEPRRHEVQLLGN